MKPNFARNLLVNALAQIRTMRAAMLWPRRQATARVVRVRVCLGLEL